MAGVYKWTTIDRICNTALTAVGNIALARLLSPAEFGLLAMVQIFWALAFNFSNWGMCDGLIQKLHPTEEDYSTVFTFNTGTGILISLILIALAKPVMWIYNQPALENIMWAIGICFFFQTLCIVQETRLRKELKMKKIAIVHISSSFCAIALGIALAAGGYGYWGLVSCRIFLSVFLFFFYLIATRWIPKLHFYKKSFHEMFHYGVNLMISYLANQITLNFNAMVLGKIQGGLAGIYSQGQKLVDVPFKIIDSIFNWPFFAVLSNEADPQIRKGMCRQMLSSVSLVSIGGGMLLALMASPLFKVLFGAKWDPAIPIFRILLCYGILSVFKYFMQTILKSYDCTALVRNYTILEVVIQLTTLALVFRRGIEWIAWTQVGAAALVMPLYLYRYCKLQEESLGNVVSSVTKGLIVPTVACVITAAAYWVWNGNVPEWINLLGVLAMFGGICILLWEIFPVNFYIKLRNRVVPHIPFLKSLPPMTEDNPTDMI